MNQARASVTGIWAAFFIVACSSGPGASPQGGTGGTGGASGSPSGGASGGSATAGVSGLGTGGLPSTSSGGSPAVTTGGSPGGTLTGGTPSSATGGMPGTATGGAVGVTTGGDQGNAGVPGGGAQSSGGAPSGGSGGAATPLIEPKLVTSAKDAFWKEGMLTEVTSGAADTTVNDSSVQQSWDGFGGTFNEAGWKVLSLLSAADRDRAIQLLFGVDGAHFAYGRVPIGASDYANDRYTLDETKGDYTMEKFSIERDKQALIPFIKAALALRSDLHLWASPWTPPTWMKDNGAMDGGNMKDDAQTLTAHALYLSKFVEEYGKEGVKIEAIHPQNEPGYETRYPSCLWTPELMTKFIRDYLGPTFTTRNVTAQIFLGTMSNADAGKDGTIISTVTGDAGASKFIKGFGLQWNMINSVASLKSRNVPIVQSEHKCGNYPWNPAGFPMFDPDKPANDYAYGVESWGLIRDWVKAGVNVYSAWNMVLDKAGKNLDSMRPWPQNALLTIDTAAKTLTVTPAYYVFRHVSQFVDPGAKVVGTAGGEALAFKNPDGTIVTVLYNSGAAKKSIVSIGGKLLQFDMPANGWATVNWK
jgi:glucosylceramidase